jgi:hypothetical protein
MPYWRRAVAVAGRAGSLTLSASLTGVGAGLAFFLLYLLLNALAALPRPEARGHRFA